MSQRNKLNFSGQAIFVGLDVHKKSWKVAIYTKDFEHKAFSQDPSPEKLVAYLGKNFPGANYHTVYEAGFCGFWAHRKLKALGVDSIVTNPADVPTKDKERRRKCDRVDCRKLARSLRNGNLEAIYVPSRETLEDRFLLRMRKSLVKDQARYKNRIKSALRFYGINIYAR